jgi:hypothetical protein
MSPARRIIAAAAILIISGCTNHCHQLAERVCKRAAGNAEECRVDPDVPESENDCRRLKAVSASCTVLQHTAKDAGDDEQVACQADLELIRALEKQQM